MSFPGALDSSEDLVHLVECAIGASYSTVENLDVAGEFLALLDAGGHAGRGGAGGFAHGEHAALKCLRELAGDAVDVFGVVAEALELRLGGVNGLEAPPAECGGESTHGTDGNADWCCDAAGELSTDALDVVADTGDGPAD